MIMPHLFLSLSHDLPAEYACLGVVHVPFLDSMFLVTLLQYLVLFLARNSI